MHAAALHRKNSPGSLVPYPPALHSFLLLPYPLPATFPSPFHTPHHTSSHHYLADGSTVWRTWHSPGFLPNSLHSPAHAWTFALPLFYSHTFSLHCTYLGSLRSWLLYLHLFSNAARASAPPAFYRCRCGFAARSSFLLSPRILACWVPFYRCLLAIPVRSFGRTPTGSPHKNKRVLRSRSKAIGSVSGWFLLRKQRNALSVEPSPAWQIAGTPPAHAPPQTVYISAGCCLVCGVRGSSSLCCHLAACLASGSGSLFPLT